MIPVVTLGATELLAMRLSCGPRAAKIALLRHSGTRASRIEVGSPG
jgi:hypothetical protein